MTTNKANLKFVSRVEWYLAQFLVILAIVSNVTHAQFHALEQCRL